MSAGLSGASFATAYPWLDAACSPWSSGGISYSSLLHGAYAGYVGFTPCIVTSVDRAGIVKEVKLAGQSWPLKRRDRQQITVDSAGKVANPAGVCAALVDERRFAVEYRDLWVLAAMKSETGLPMTLGNAAKAELRLIVWCHGCKRQVEQDPAELVERHGAFTPVLDWRERLVCSKSPYLPGSIGASVRSMRNAAHSLAYFSTLQPDDLHRSGQPDPCHRGRDCP